MRKNIYIALLILLIAGVTPSQAASINNSNNKTACTYSRNHIKMQAMMDWSKGLATDQDLLNELTAQAKMWDKLTFTNGSIKTQIVNVSTATKRMRVALVNGSDSNFIAGYRSFNTSLNKLNSLCKSIGK